MSCSTYATRSFGRQRLEHHEQREPDGIGDQHLLLGVGLLVDLDDRLGHPGADIVLAARLPGAQHVDADAADDRGQPRAGVVDRLLLGAAEPQPGFLQRILGLADRSEHAIGDRLQVWPVALELLGLPADVVQRLCS